MKPLVAASILGLLAACSESDSQPNVGPDGSVGPAAFEITSFSASGDGAGTLEVEFLWALADPDGLVLECRLDPGDGGGEHTVDCAAGAGSHTYGAEGSYRATFTAASASESVSATAEVEVAPPGALPSWAQQLAAETGPAHARGVDVDADGNSYLVGWVGSGGVIEGVEASAGADDVLLAKVDADGQTVWVEQLGTGGDDVAWAVDVAGDGTIYVTGWTGGDLVAPNAGIRDAFLLAFGPDGGQLWGAQVGSAGSDIGQGVAVHEASGAVYVAGQTSGAIEGATGEGPGFVARFTAAGALSWVTQFEALDDGLGQNTRGLAVGADGTAYVTGWVAQGIELNHPSTQAFLVAVSAAGAVTSRQTFGADGAADQGHVVAASEDGVYVGGSTRGSFGGEYANGWDSFVVAFDSDGAQRWVVQHSGDFDDHVYGLDVDGAGNVYAAGESYAGAGDNRAVVTSYRPDGDERWSGEVAGGRASGYDVAVAQSGGVLVCGDTGADLDGESMAGGFVDGFVAAVAPAPAP